MRITGLSFGVLLFSMAALAAEETPFARIADLASAFSENDPDGVLRIFDPQMKDYGAIEAYVEALSAQTDVSCAIDVVSDQVSGGVHKLDLDWFMQLTTQNDNPQVERRRERVRVEMTQIKGRWKITALTPLSIFEPIHVR